MVFFAFHMFFLVGTLFVGFCLGVAAAPRLHDWRVK
jgi:hypothetical protein